jgi:hypothetical protein
MESNWVAETIEAWDGLILVMQSAVGVSWCLEHEMAKNDNTKARQHCNFNPFFIRKVLSLTSQVLKALQRRGPVYIK